METPEFTKLSPLMKAVGEFEALASSFRGASHRRIMPQAAPTTFGIVAAQDKESISEDETEFADLGNQILIGLNTSAPRRFLV